MVQHLASLLQARRPYVDLTLDLGTLGLDISALLLIQRGREHERDPFRTLALVLIEQAEIELLERERLLYRLIDLLGQISDNGGLASEVGATDAKLQGDRLFPHQKSLYPPKRAGDPFLPG